MIKTIWIILFLTTILLANENWIPIQAINKTQVSKKNTKLDVNLSQIEPINKMMRNANVVKQIIDATSKKEKRATNDKNWYAIDNNGE